MSGWIDRLRRSRALRGEAPRRPFSGAQKEQHVLFLHYRVAPELLRPLVPDELELQLIDGSAWVAVIGLRVDSIHVGRFRVPRVLGSFPEIDAAALVSDQGRGGLHFIGIEGAHRFGSWLTRVSTGLPYRYARTRLHRTNADGAVTWHISSGPRWVRGGAAAAFDAWFTPAQSLPWNQCHEAARLAAQYSAFMVRHGKVKELDEVHHAWKLNAVELELRSNSIPASFGLPLIVEPSLRHYSQGEAIISWLPKQVRPGRPGLAPASPST